VVNHVLSNLLHLHWPGVVTHLVSGEDVACINWDMFATSSIVDIRMPRELFGMSFG
jgi:tRNA A37 threonylcarbamoyladenosine synthetase subunit TsaC/SUA5/YrdC